MGQLLLSQGLSPDTIVSSTAVRAMKTAEVVADRCYFDGEVQTDHRLYLADSNTILNIASRVSAEAKRILVVGHNPGLEDLVTRLTGCEEQLPTAGLAQIVLKIDQWKDMSLSTGGQLLNCWRPKELSNYV